MDNANSREYLEKILSQVLENMKRTAHAPSVQMTDVPRDSLGLNDDDEAALDDLDEDENPDKRHTERRSDKYVQKNGELSDSEDEDPDERQGRRRRVQANFRHIMDVGANDSGVETGSGVGTPMQGSSVPDDADEMNIDSVEPPIASPSPPNGPTNGSAAVSNPQSPSQPPAADDGDIEMEDADVNGDTAPVTNHAAAPEEESTITVQQQRTPPDSPPQTQEQEEEQTEEPAPVPPTTVSLTAPPPTIEPAEVAMESAPELPVAPAPAPTASAVEAVEEAEPEPEAVIKPEPEEANDDIAKAQAAEDGRIEREVANAEGEARTEQAAKAEEADEPNTTNLIDEPKD
jgi:histone deacetylase 1/2